MPGPAIYIVAVIGTVAAAYAFKEFVFEPHLRPKMDAWIETMEARRRERRNRGRQPIAVPLTSHSRSSSSSSGNDDDGQTKSTRRRRKSSLDSEYSSSPIELEKLAAREMDEWRSGADIGGDQSGLRFRHGRGPSSLSRAASTPNIIDEQPTSSISTPTLEPSTSEHRDVLFHYPSSPVFGAQSSSTLLTPTADEPGFNYPSPPPSTTLSSPIDLPAVRTPSPSTPLAMDLTYLAPSPIPSRSSTPDSDLLASSMLTSNYLTPLAAPRSIAPSPSPSPNRALSPEANYDILSPTSPRSGAMSPFSDVERAGMSSPMGGTDLFLSPPSMMDDLPSDMEFQSALSDDEVFSLPSESRAPTEAGDEQFEVGSDDSDDWTGIDDEVIPPH